MKKTVLKIFKSFLLSFLIFIASIVILSNFNISVFGMRIFRVVTGSMEPEILIGDIILIKEQDDYKVNDIITFRYKDNYITHRIIKIDDNEIITKGDGNNKSDEPITKDNVVGKVIFYFKGLNYLFRAILNPISLILIFASGIVFIKLFPGDDEESDNDEEVEGEQKI